MGKPGMDAEYRGEERYSKLSIAFGTQEEEDRVNTAIKDITSEFKIQPQIYSSDISNGRKAIIIEYHDDYDRDAGVIFERLMKTLDITECD